MFANGGKRIKPTLIDRIQDRSGQTIYRHDERAMRRLRRRELDRPGRAEARRQARAGARSADRLPDRLDPGGRGAARHRARSSRRSASRSPARPARPTTPRTPGSSASRPISRSASIIGFDKPRSLGDTATGGQYAAPIFRDFMKVALKDKPATPFRVPPGIKLIRVDRASGMRAGRRGRRASSRPSSPARRRPTAIRSSA